MFTGDISITERPVLPLRSSEMTQTRIMSRIKTVVMRSEFPLCVVVLYQLSVQKALRRFDRENYILQRVKIITF